MGFWLFSAIVLQLACAICAGKLGRPTVWLQIILLVPVLGSLAYCGYELMRGRSIRPRRTSSGRPAFGRERSALGWLGYRAVRAQTVDGRRALAEDCMRVGRHADARLLFESCMVDRDAGDPDLIASLEKATALTDAPVRSTGGSD